MVIAANIHIFSIMPKASGVIILCPTGKYVSFAMLYYS